MRNVAEMRVIRNRARRVGKVREIVNEYWSILTM
jgi:sporulation protein YlmC with PRC-barrel domain